MSSASAFYSVPSFTGSVFQIFARLTPHFGWLWGKVMTEVIALDLTAPVLRIISGYLNVSLEHQPEMEKINNVTHLNL